MRVASVRDPNVRATAIIHSLLEQRGNVDARLKTLDDTWKNESDQTIQQLLQEFRTAEADEAHVPFLVHAIGAVGKRSILGWYACQAIRKHDYQSAIPGLLKIFEKQDAQCFYAARALGYLKAKEAYEPIVKQIRDKHDISERSSTSLVQALCYLQDERLAPFLIEAIKSQHSNAHINDSWVEPLQNAMEIPDRDLQLLAIEILGRIEWFRANPALSKIQELRNQRIDDAEFRRAADATVKHIDR